MLLSALSLTGCATTDEQRFPLDYISGQRAAQNLSTAGDSFAAYKRMGADLKCASASRNSGLALGAFCWA